MGKDTNIVLLDHHRSNYFFTWQIITKRHMRIDLSPRILFQLQKQPSQRSLSHSVLEIFDFPKRATGATFSKISIALQVDSYQIIFSCNKKLEKLSLPFMTITEIFLTACLTFMDTDEPSDKSLALYFKNQKLNPEKSLKELFIPDKSELYLSNRPPQTTSKPASSNSPGIPTKKSKADASSKTKKRPQACFEYSYRVLSH